MAEKDYQDIAKQAVSEIISNAASQLGEQPVPVAPETQPPAEASPNTGAEKVKDGDGEEKVKMVVGAEEPFVCKDCEHYWEIIKVPDMQMTSLEGEAVYDHPLKEFLRYCAFAPGTLIDLSGVGVYECNRFKPTKAASCKMESKKDLLKDKDEVHLVLKNRAYIAEEAHIVAAELSPSDEAITEPVTRSKSSIEGSSL